MSDQNSAKTANPGYRDPAKMVTGVCTFSYLNCWSPRLVPGATKAKYSVVLLIPKDDDETVTKIHASIKAAYEKGQDTLKGADDTVPAIEDILLPLKDGDKDRPNDKAYAGCWFLKASSSTAPGVIDSCFQRITKHSEMYSGVKGRASITFYAFNAVTSRGIAVGLNNLQKIANGTPIARKVTAQEDFAK